MPPSPSRFQLLPDDIVGEIVDYLSPPSYMSVRRNTKMAILHSCQNLRAAYMRKYLSAIDVHYNQDKEVVIEFKNIDIPFDPLLYPIDKLVRTLTINIPIWKSVLNGEIVELMQISPNFASIGFASVTTLIINAPYNPFSRTSVSYEALDDAKNTAAFFRHIKSLVPNAKNISLLLPGCQEWSSESRDIDLVESSIAELVCGCNFTFGERAVVYSFSAFNPAVIFGLTSLCLDVQLCLDESYTASWPFEVARLNVMTLKRIKLPPFSAELLEQLLFSDGLPIIYPSLVRMEVVISDFHDQPLEPVDLISSENRGIDINHFPVLKRLRFAGSFRYVTGHLFGSENRSLEYLDVVNHFNQSNTFTVGMSTRFYGLKTVIFGMEDRNDEAIIDYTDYKPICEQTFKLFACSPSATYRISMEFKLGSEILELLDDCDIWATLRGLYIPTTLFSFTELLDLLTNAPMLQYLYCSLDDEPPFINDIDLREHPEYLKERYCPLNTSLSKLMLGSNYDFNTQDIHNISWSALHLARLYPQLRNLGFAECFGKEYGPTIIRSKLDRGASLAEQADSLCSDIKNLPINMFLIRVRNLSRGILFY